MSALYGAAGVAHDPELTRVLLEAGANPDDGESLYHSTESPSTACLALAARARREHEPIRTPWRTPSTTSGSTTSDCCSRREPTRTSARTSRTRSAAGADPEFVRLLAEHGADLIAPGGETWRGNVPLRTPYQHARLRGPRRRRRDARRARRVDDVVRRRRPRVARARRAADHASPGRLDVDAQEVIVLSALRGHVDAVFEAVGPDYRGVVGGSPRARWSGTRPGWGTPRLSTGFSS